MLKNELDIARKLMVSFNLSGAMVGTSWEFRWESLSLKSRVEQEIFSQDYIEPTWEQSTTTCSTKQHRGGLTQQSDGVMGNFILAYFSDFIKN